MFFGNDNKITELAVKAIKEDKLVAIPTETVYGLAANALSEKAVEQIFKAKGRPADNPLIIHISDISEAEKYAYFTEDAKKAAEKFWPGPLTLILKKKETVPYSVTAGLDSVAIRLPDSKITRELIRKSGAPLAAPSANISGRPSPTKAQHVYNDYKDAVDENGNCVISGIIDGGECKRGVESTIIALTGPRPILLRPGFITFEQLKEIFPDITVADAVFTELKKNEKPISPGMAHRHYSPKTETVGICGSSENIVKYINNRSKYERTAVMCFAEDENKFSDSVTVMSYGEKDSPEILAKNLFSVLRELDKKNADKIYVEIIFDSGVYLAVYNRLIRACGFTVIDADIPPVSISVTGPSGAGKSSLCQALEKCGFCHINGDRIAAEILPLQKEKLAKAFGNSIFDGDGSINRTKLANEAFSSKENTDKLNSVMHPPITDKIKEILDKNKKLGIPSLIDGAAIFEAGINKITDFTINVTAPVSIRKYRVRQRDNITEEMIEKRFSSQLSDEFYNKNSDLTVYNDGTEDINQLKNKILDFIKGGK